MNTDKAQLIGASPFLIVENYRASVDYYVHELGFECIVEAPPDDPFFALVRRDGALLALKEIAPDVLPVPNCSRHEYARWDAFILTWNPTPFTPSTARGA